jgi:hypothetical protein
MAENDQPESGGDLVTVASFRDLSEALPAKGKLEAAEIPCVPADDNILRMDWFLSNLIGGVTLSVPEAQAVTAYELLFCRQEPAPGEQETVKCLKCGFEEVGVVDPARGIRLASLFTLGLPLPRTGSLRRECANCGAKWMEEEDQNGNAGDPSSLRSSE